MGPWVEHDPGRCWTARYADGEPAAMVVVAIPNRDGTPGQGYDVHVHGSGRGGHYAASELTWRHDARDARNAALAALRARGLTTPPDEPEPTPACPCRWGSCEAHGHAHECGLSRGHVGPCECHVCLRSMADDAPLVTPATEAPTAPSEPDEGAVSPAGPGEAVRPRVGVAETVAFAVQGMAATDALLEGGAHVDPGARLSAATPRQDRDSENVYICMDCGARGLRDLRAHDVVCPGAHVDPGVRERAGAELVDALARRDAELVRLRAVLGAGDGDLLEQARTVMGAALRGGAEVASLRAEVARLTAELERVQDVADTRKRTIADLDTTITTIRFALGDSPNGWVPPEGFDPVVDLALAVRRERDAAVRTLAGGRAVVALLDRIAEALGIPGDWRDYADDVLVTTAADWREQAKRHEDAATVARGEVAVLREAMARLTEQAEAIRDVEVVLGVTSDQVLPRLRELVRAEAKGETNQALVNLFVQGRRA